MRFPFTVLRQSDRRGGDFVRRSSLGTDLGRLPAR